MDLGVRSQPDYVSDWILHLEADNCAANTVRNYEQRVRRFEVFLKEQGLTFKTVRPKHFDVFKIFLLKGLSLSAQSANLYLSSVRVFFKWLHWTEAIQVNYPASMRGMRVPKPIPRPFEEADIKRLLEAAPYDRPWALAWVETQYSTGCRISEVLNLCWADIHLEEGYASVTGKGMKGRNVPLGRPAIAALRAWKAAQDSKGIPTSGNAPVWLGKAGRPMERRVVTRMLKRLAKRAGVEGDIKTHRLRHSFATHMLDHGEDVRVIQELLGHEDIKSTQIYTKVSSARMLKAFRRAHPRA